MEEFQQALITISSHVSPAQWRGGGHWVPGDNGHSSFAADTIHSEGAVTACPWFVLTWSIYQIKVKVKTVAVYGEVKTCRRLPAANLLTRPVIDVWRGLDSSYSHIIHSIGSHNYNIIRQFKSQFINYTLENTQRKAQLQHFTSISLCQMDHVWYIHLKETVVAASECSIEELRVSTWDLVRARSLPICWLPQKVPSEGS